MSKEEREETERLLLEELARREQGVSETTPTASNSSSLLLAGASGANKVVSATFSAFNETLNTILDTKRDQEEEDKFWESVPVLPLEEGEEDEREYKEDFGGKSVSGDRDKTIEINGKPMNVLQWAISRSKSKSE